MKDTQVACVAPTGCVLGEGPLWSPSEGVLWWIDIKRAKLHRYNPKTGNTRRMDLPIRASVLALCNGDLLLAGDREVGLYDPETEAYERKVALSAEGPGIRTNDGGLAPDGAFWVGVMHDAEKHVAGRFYRIGPDFSVSLVNAPRVMVTNLAQFSNDGRTFYTSDSVEQEILAYDHDPETGRLSDRRVFATTTALGGYPDGGAMDAEGALWVCLWDAGRLVRYRPDGRIDRQVELPVSRPTSCTFGGPDLTTLYITSARIGIDGEALMAQSMAGGLFALEVEVPGRRQRSFGVS